MNEMRKLIESLNRIGEAEQIIAPVPPREQHEEAGTLALMRGGVKITIDYDAKEVSLNHGHGENIWLRLNDWQEFVDGITGQGLREEEQIDEAAGQILYMLEIEYGYDGGSVTLGIYDSKNNALAAMKAYVKEEDQGHQGLDSDSYTITELTINAPATQEHYGDQIRADGGSVWDEL